MPAVRRASVQQASLPKNNGARELVDPYVIVGSVQHWKTKPRAYSEAAQATVFFLQLALRTSVQSVVYIRIV